MIAFNDIKSKNDLARFLRVPLKTLTYILYVKKPDNYYNSFEIPKKNSEPRHINAPSGELKALQRKIADALWEFQKELVIDKKIRTNISHGFEKEKSIITNAKIHLNKRYVLNLDLENFFESFHFGRVRGYFEKNYNFNLPIEVATIMAQLTCYKGRLPQGAPSSPIITNLICNILDMYLLKVAKRFKLDYTRYADDLTFSTNDKYFPEYMTEFLNETRNEIERFGLSINDSKTRLIYKDSRQEVTGLVVNKKISVNRDYYKKTRAMANYLYKYGNFMIDGTYGNVNQLEGRFAFINHLDHYNNKLRKGKDKINMWKLNSRERDYQKFIFYKYFFANAKPLIVVEGKTDIVYIKAALKKHYNDYPSLIQKNGDRYEYKISFLTRTPRMGFFLNISSGGADTMKNIYNIYTGNVGFPNLFKCLTEESKCVPEKPVILIFDNEQISDKPLKNFKSHIKTRKDLNLSDQIIGNLFMTTNPLVKGLKNCEIEDLFDDSVLSLKISGKDFSGEKDFDTSEHYGKVILASYISNNYKLISFERFKPMLDELNDIVNNYGTMFI